jgi:hypothetical protein
MVKKRNEVRWNAPKPDGTPRKLMDRPKMYFREAIRGVAGMEQENLKCIFMFRLI